METVSQCARRTVRSRNNHCSSQAAASFCLAHPMSSQTNFAVRAHSHSNATQDSLVQTTSVSSFHKLHSIHDLSTMQSSLPVKLIQSVIKLHGINGSTSGKLLGGTGGTPALNTPINKHARFGSIPGFAPLSRQTQLQPSATVHSCNGGFLRRIRLGARRHIASPC